MVELWNALDNAILKRRSADDDVVSRFLQKPWESIDVQVRVAGLAITDPANLSRLEGWLSPDMNPTAREYTEAGLKECRSRAEEGPK
jgi:hypothetical protein